MKRIATMTLGCKVNHTETQALEGMFTEVGYEVVSFDSEAEIYLINTCSVTNLGEKKSRQTIRRAIRKCPGATVVVTGCYAQSAPGELAQIDGIDLIVGTQDRDQLVSWVEEQKVKKEQQIHVSDILKARKFEDLPAHEVGRSRAFFKVQEGCNQFCTYCIIPYTRGPLRSRSLESVKRESERLWSQGFKEIVLTGIHLGAYGLELKDRPNLANLVQVVLGGSTDGRIRLGSLESVEVSSELLALLIKEKNICKHLHLPLQSGSDAILKSMGRPYQVDKFLILLKRIREVLPTIAITTDIIVGFPGETEEQFEETLETVMKCQFSDVHVFPYSPRRGTPAAQMNDPVPEEIKKNRAQKLQKLALSLRSKYLALFIEKEVQVLWEDVHSGDMISGWSQEYIRIYGKSTDHKVGTLETVVGRTLYQDGLRSDEK